MNIEHILFASAGCIAYEILFWKDLLANEIKNGKHKIQFRISYICLLTIWIPICGIIAFYLFQDDIEKPSNYILIGFGLPSALKTLSSKATSGFGGRNLGGWVVNLASKKFFHVGER